MAARIPEDTPDVSKAKDDYLHLAWELHVLREVIRLRSFGAATELLDTSASSVTRAIQSLERKIGAGPLIVRLPRNVKLTPAGAAIHSDLLSALHFMEKLLQRKLQPEARLGMPVIVRCPAMMLSVLPRLADTKFRSLSPPLKTEFFAVEDPPAPVLRVDVTLNFAGPPGSGWITRRLGEERWMFVASPDVSRNLEDSPSVRGLQQQRFLQIGDPGLNGEWQLCLRGEKPARYKLEARSIADADFVLDDAIRGRGVAIVPRWLAADEVGRGTLVQVFQSWQISPGSGSRQLLGHVDHAALEKSAFASRVLAFLEQWYQSANDAGRSSQAGNRWRA